MEHFAGLDVSVKDTSVCIVDDTGKIIREVKVASEPEALSAVLKSPAYHFKRIGLEAGPLSQWLLSALAEAGLPAICVETRHMQAVLKAQINNQIKPILRLSEAAESFGKGRPPPDDFRPRGAREVRQAAHAFIEMRDRIERHVEQRTIMLAGVSHDLRTVLTRFKLQLAMFEQTPELEAMRADVDEMQAMLEDYMAFAKGDSGEEIVRADIGEILSEVKSQAHGTKNIAIEVKEAPLVVPVRRHAFKRAVANLVNNAARFAERVKRQRRQAQWRADRRGRG